MAQREKKKNGKVVLKKGQRLSWASMGNVAVPENKLVGFEKDKGIDEIKRRLG